MSFFLLRHFMNLNWEKSGSNDVNDRSLALNFILNNQKLFTSNDMTILIIDFGSNNYIYESIFIFECDKLEAFCSR